MERAASSVPGEFMRGFATKGVFPRRWAFTLLIPLRNIFLSPKRLIRRLGLQKDHTVLEVGPGPGYFSKKIAKFLTQGSLFLSDIQPEMLDYAKKRLDKAGVTNVDYCCCDGKMFPYPDGMFDRIFMVTVLGEVENKEDYMWEFRRMLKPDGILSISELAGDVDKMTTDEVTALADGAGLEFCERFGNDRNYTVNFRRP